MEQESTQQEGRTQYSHSHRLVWVLVCVLGAFLAFGGYQYWVLLEESERTEQELENEIASLEEENASLEEARAELENQRADLSEALEAKRREVDEFDERLAEVTQGVDSIRNTINTDPELLRKYSRVYFLSENYVPEELEEIDEEYVESDKEQSVHERVYPYLEDMIEDAEDDGIDLRVVSAYRSFDEQNEINDSHTVVYGAGTANQFSAEQGYSEHQLGTTVDFTIPEMNGALDESFGETEAFEWLEEHAYEYGFALSYPKGNRFYEYEPWHWRFVSIPLAEDLHDDGLYFYDLNQREIDTYRPEFFE